MAKIKSLLPSVTPNQSDSTSRDLRAHISRSQPSQNPSLEYTSNHNTSSTSYENYQGVILDISVVLRDSGLDPGDMGIKRTIDGRKYDRVLTRAFTNIEAKDEYLFRNQSKYSVR